MASKKLKLTEEELKALQTYYGETSQPLEDIKESLEFLKKKSVDFNKVMVNLKIERKSDEKFSQDLIKQLDRILPIVEKLNEKIEKSFRKKNGEFRGGGYEELPEEDKEFRGGGYEELPEEDKGLDKRVAKLLKNYTIEEIHSFNKKEIDQLIQLSSKGGEFYTGVSEFPESEFTKIILGIFGYIIFNCKYNKLINLSEEKGDELGGIFGELDDICPTNFKVGITYLRKFSERNNEFED